jgi:hypothetical protein
MTFKSRVMRSLLSRHGGFFSRNDGKWYWSSTDGTERHLVTSSWASRKLKEEPKPVVVKTNSKKQLPPKKEVVVEKPEVEKEKPVTVEEPKPKTPIFKTPIFKQVNPEDVKPTE